MHFLMLFNFPFYHIPKVFYLKLPLLCDMVHYQAVDINKKLTLEDG